MRKRKCVAELEYADCVGCSACEAICKFGAIKMKSDSEGFLYPEVDSYKCNACGRCIQVCSFFNDKQKRNCYDEKINPNRVIYLGRHISNRVIEESRSGGIFTALSDVVISLGGVIYGVVMDNEMKAVHMKTNSQLIRDKMRGSKYVQSYIDSSIYKEIETYLVRNTYVMFSGTSCQVAALKSYLGREYDNLLCVDVVCHGVVSPRIFKEYINQWESITLSKCTGIDFRNKKFGWKEHYETLYMRDEAGDSFSIDSFLYRNIFYSHYALRKSCYSCPYKTQEHPGDITIGDCWGIENVEKKFDDNRGCSIIFVNSQKGEKWLELVKTQIDIEKHMMSNSLFQIAFHRAYEVDDKERFEFWRFFLHEGIRKIMYIYGKAGESLYYDERNVIREYMKKIRKRDSNQSTKREIIIFGAGNIANKYIPIIDTQVFEIEEIWDNYSIKKEIHNIRIVRPRDYLEKDKTIIVFLEDSRDIINKLIESGIDKDHIMDFRTFLKENAILFYENHENLLETKDRWVYEELRESVL